MLMLKTKQYCSFKITSPLIYKAIRAAQSGAHNND